MTGLAIWNHAGAVSEGYAAVSTDGGHTMVNYDGKGDIAEAESFRCQ